MAERPAVAGMRVAVVGRGKVGRALVDALRAGGAQVRLFASRRLPRSLPEVELVLITVRDGAVAATAAALAARIGGRPPRAALHTAGALDASVLAPLSARGVPVAQAHPLLSFASASRSPALLGASLVVQGDAAAVRMARTLARGLGMRIVAGRFDPAVYHAAAALVANGLVALVSIASGMLASQALDGPFERMLAPLIRSVAGHVELLGLPHALSGPVRRGDVATVRRHLDRLAAFAPDAVPLYAALVAAQLPLARALGEAEDRELAAIDRLCRAAARSSAGSPRSARARRAPLSPDRS